MSSQLRSADKIAHVSFRVTVKDKPQHIRDVARAVLLVIYGIPDSKYRSHNVEIDTVVFDVPHCRRRKLVFECLCISQGEKMAPDDLKVLE